MKEYPSGEGRSGQRMKCGAAECEHVECAIEDRRVSSSSMRTLIMLIPVSTVFTGAVIFFVALQALTILLSAAIVAVIVIGDILIAVTFTRTARRLEGQLRELQEFSQNKTVNGVPARQLHDTGQGT